MSKFQKVKIGGQELAIKFGFSALSIFEKDTGEAVASISKYGDKLPVHIAISLIYAGLKDGARSAKSEFKLTKEDIGDLLDEDIDGLTRVLKIFGDMMGKKTKKKIKTIK